MTEHTKHFSGLAPGGLQSTRLAVFLDYDGTLTRLVDHPHSATLSADMRATIAQLAQYHPVAIVSGRDRQDIQNLVNLDTMVYAGCHGFEMRGPGLPAWQHAEGATCWPALHAASQEVQQALRAIPGVRVERKGFAVAIHVRDVEPSAVPTVRESVNMLAGRYPELRVTGGKHILELRPAVAWDKGHAVSWILQALQLGDDTVPIYIGDDETDEDAFLEVRERGIGIRVTQSSQTTAARYTVRDPEEVQTFLHTLIDTFQNGDPDDMRCTASLLPNPKGSSGLTS